MTKLIKLKDGSIETVLEPRDFQYLIAKYMGLNAERWFVQLVEELTEEHDKSSCDCGSYEASLESNTMAFQDIQEYVEVMDKLLDASRLDRQKLFKCVMEIKKVIKNQI